MGATSVRGTDLTPKVESNEALAPISLMKIGI